MSGLKVIKPGVLCTIQDWGRYGYRENGLSAGGPMDEHAFLWTNRLLQNNSNSSTIEITVGLSIFESMVNSTIAVCGADMGLTINSEPATNWATHRIKVGDRLNFRSAKQGLRAYLGIKDGFQVKPFFSSTSTVVRENLGGLNGEALKKDQIILASHTEKQTHLRQVPSQFIAHYSPRTILRFIPGYQYDLFENTQKNIFADNHYSISQRMDRMGCRLEGEKVAYHGPGIISEGIAVGSIQIPPDGQPIILLKDSGSIGGYPKLGCVARTDLNKLAQCRPGDSVKFELTDQDQLTQELLCLYRFFKLKH